MKLRKVHRPVCCRCGKRVRDHPSYRILTRPFYGPNVLVLICDACRVKLRYHMDRRIELWLSRKRK